jgi:molybdate transport system substrate-binding protein
MMIDRRFCLAGGLATFGVGAARSPLTIYAAASMQEALSALGGAYTARGGGAVTFSFAASSVLARQIEQGARADVFVSADSAWMDYLAQRRLIAPRTRRDIASARLVLVAPKVSTLHLPIQHGFPIAKALSGGRIALADPDSVPAGRYAKAALTGLGVWPAVEPKVARTENVRAALAFVARGEAPLGVVYDTDALAEPDVKVIGVFPASSYPKIVYPAAAIAASRQPQSAAALVAFMVGREGRTILGRYGFSPPL